MLLSIHGAIQQSLVNQVFMKKNEDHLFGDDYIFFALAFGRQELNLGTVGVVMSGSVRLGLENNLYLTKVELVKSNADLVAGSGGS